MPRDQGEPALPAGYGVFALSELPVTAVFSQGEFLVHSHGINELAVTGARAEIGTACTDDPISFDCQFNHIAAFRLELAPGECAAAARRVWGNTVVVLNDVGE
jgi:hypothetical protein